VASRTDEAKDEVTVFVFEHEVAVALGRGRLWSHSRSQETQ
jgi:hypothetical protein